MFIGDKGGKASFFPLQLDNGHRLKKVRNVNEGKVPQQILSPIVPWNRRFMGGTNLTYNDFNDLLEEGWILSIAINVYDCAFENKRLNGHTSYLNTGVFMIKRFPLQ